MPIGSHRGIGRPTKRWQQKKKRGRAPFDLRTLDAAVDDSIDVFVHRTCLNTTRQNNAWPERPEQECMSLRPQRTSYLVVEILSGLHGVVKGMRDAGFFTSFELSNTRAEQTEAEKTGPVPNGTVVM